MRPRSACLTRSPKVAVTSVQVVASVLVLAFAATACGQDHAAVAPSSTTTAPASAHRFSGFVQSPPRQVAEVTLPSTDGRTVSMVAEPGGLLLVYFGYTFCPDVCPTTMAFVKRSLATLPPSDRARVQVAMATVDPGRDTAKKLTDYVRAFVPEGIALRTDDQARLRAATEAFGADFKVSTGGDGKVEVSHTGELYVVDEKGAVILAWPFGTSMKSIRTDLDRLLAGERPPST